MFSVISVMQLEWLLDQKRPLLLVDLRLPQEYQRGNLKDAVNIPYELLEEGILKDYWGTTLIFYCEHGGKSMKAARDFGQRGWDAVSLGCGIPYYRGKYMVSS